MLWIRVFNTLKALAEFRTLIFELPVWHSDSALQALNAICQKIKDTSESTSSPATESSRGEARCLTFHPRGHGQ